MSYSEDLCIRPSPRLGAAKSLRKNPINLFARLAIAEAYEAERIGVNEFHMAMPGIWCDHDVSFVWKPDTEYVDLFLLFDGRAPGGRVDEICRLLALINERLASGHFEYWDKDAALVFRNGINLSGGAELNLEQAMAVLATALDAAEKGYPACQYLLWAGKTPQEAIDAALIDLAVHA